MEHATITSFRYKLPRRAAAAAAPGPSGVGPDPQPEQLRLSTVFGRLEDAKAGLCIAEYSLGQTTLEQVCAVCAVCAARDVYVRVPCSAVWTAA